MPFLTEELWHKLPMKDSAASIALAPYPESRKEWNDPTAEKQVADLQEIAVRTRNLRAEIKIDPKKSVPVTLMTDNEQLGFIVRSHHNLLLAATASAVTVASGSVEPLGGHVSTAAQYALHIAEGAGVDKLTEIAKIKKETERLAKDIESKTSRLADESFRSRAPAEIVRAMEATLAERQIEYRKLLERLAQLK
jgi:valyl-tRNA synthetase